MKKNIYLLIFISILFSTVTFVACDEDDNEDVISYYDRKESRNMKDNCMTCHKIGGTGKSVFIVAGTVYNDALTETYPNATVKLYSGQNGTGNLLGTIEVDGLGNFYTTNIIDLSQGVYPTITGTNANTQYMPASTSSGACNSCHGNTTSKLYAK